MIRAYYQVAGGHVYPILKDGIFSGKPIFSLVKKSDIEKYFDEIIEVATVDDLPQVSVSADAAGVMHRDD